MITCKACGEPTTVDGTGECYRCYKESEINRLSEYLQYLENRGQDTLEEKEEILNTMNAIKNIKESSL